MFLTHKDIDIASSGNFRATINNGVLKSLDGSLDTTGAISPLNSLNLRLRYRRDFDPGLCPHNPIKNTVVQFTRIVPETQEAVCLDLSARKDRKRQPVVSRLQFTRLEPGRKPDLLVVSGRQFQGQTDIAFGSGASVTVTPGENSDGVVEINIV